MNFTQADTAASCLKWAPTVQPAIGGLDAGRLLWAYCMNESSGGTNCGPRFEPAYYKGGLMYTTSVRQRLLVAAYDKDAASSFGPMQLMFPNAPDGTRPEDFDNLDKAMELSVEFLVTQLVRFKSVTLTTCGQIWNHGSPWRPPLTDPSRPIPAGIAAYCKQLEGHYDAGLPT